jgi:hypothetical protein
MSPSDQTSPIVIVGGGSAGLGCALSVAGQGVNVVLLEKTAELGGTVKQALIHTLGGLFDDQGNLLNAGLPAELIERLNQACPHTKRRRIGKTWVLDIDPAIYAQTITNWVATMPNIEVMYHASINDISIYAGYIEQIDIICNQETRTLQPQILVDTTGNASVVQHIANGSVDDGLALAGFIVQLRGVAPDTLKFPQGVALLREVRKAADNRQLPSECATVWLDNGIYPDEVYVKFNVTAADYEPSRMQRVAEHLLTFLHTLPGFAEAFINTSGQLGIRDGGRIRGEYCLTEADIKEGKRFADVACRACWPIEYWHPDTGISLEYLPAGQNYDIPLRSLKVAGFTNLWAAGKCLSAEPRAQASARVVGTCWAMGEAVGKHITRNLR